MDFVADAVAEPGGVAVGDDAGGKAEFRNTGRA